MTVKYIVKDNAAIITLSRPKYLNTLMKFINLRKYLIS